MRPKRLAAFTVLFRAVVRGQRPGAPSLGERLSATPQMVREALSGRYAALGRTRLALLGLALALPALWWHPDHLPGASTWAALLALGVLCTGVAYVLYFRLIERAGPARALTVTYLIPVFAVAYGVLLLGESVTAWMVMCGVVVLAGTALASGLVRLPGLARAAARS